ncbi:MAG: ABC transporter ATP-binding protein [Haloarculaceae archaeon]
MTDEESDGGADRPLLSVRDLAHAFGDVHVLDGVSFEAERGAIVCLVGPNGSGKTTLLRCVAGLLAPDEGSVTVTSDADRPVGYLPQTPAFQPRFTLAETLSFYGTLAGADLDVDATLERVGLGTVPDRRVAALSGGMTRLFGIAQATVGDPPLVVLDEPSSGLDPAMVEHISGVVGSLAADGAAVVLATHNVSAVQQMADRVLVLEDGHIAADDAPAALLEETGADTLDGALAAIIDREGTTVSAGRGGDGA